MKNSNKKLDAARLRQNAEELLKKNPSKANLDLSDAEMLNLIHELEVHQVELELQNEELILARSTAQDAAAKYIELYDFAPTGYLTLSKEGAIIEINLCASQILDKERSHLKDSMFGFFISDDTKPIFNLFLSKGFNSNTKETCDVVLSTKSNVPMHVRLTGIVSENGEQFLVTMVDITDTKRSERELEKWASIFQPKLN